MIDNIINTIKFAFSNPLVRLADAIEEWPLVVVPMVVIFTGFAIYSMVVTVNEWRK